MNFHNKLHHKETANETVNEQILLQYIIIRNESWIYDHDIETNAQLFQWMLPDEQDCKMNSQFSQMLKFFFNSLFNYCNIMLNEV